MSTESTQPDDHDTPGEQTASDTSHETSQKDSAAADESSDSPPADSAPDQDQAKTMSSASRNIAIGSQRDVADVKSHKPKAVEAALANPLQIASPVEQIDSSPQIKSAAGLGDNLDAEIEAALGGLSMDDIVASTQATETELEPRSRVKGTVTKIHDEHVFFKLAGQYEGIASLSHFPSPPEEGSVMEVIVRELNREDGLYELGIPGSAISVADWEDINEGDVVEAVVTGSNTGGLEAKVNNLKGFIPASQIDRFRVEDFSEYIGKKLPCVVVEVNPDKRKLVISHRGMLERENEAKRKALLETIEAGQLHEGIVTKLMDFGAFVDLGGLEGLIHISKLSWTRVKHPSEVLTEGQKVKVKIESIDKDTGKMSLSHRDTLDHPWENIHEKFQQDDVVKGRVTRIAPFGAFVQLASGVEGLVHISEIDYKRVVAVKNYVNEGDEVEVKILSIDPANNKMSLSMKAVQSPPKPAAQVDAQEEEEDVPVREQIVPKRKGPLKGGTDRESGGEQFGLKW